LLNSEAVKAPVGEIDGVSVAMIGQAAAWFHVERDGDSLLVGPRQPLPRRCTFRPAAFFQQDRGFPDVNTVMGRLTFPSGATQMQRYRPFTRDPHRKLRELFFPVETMPDDDWPVSAARWSNYRAIAKRLLTAADVAWQGLTAEEIDVLVRFVTWPEPLEGCVLHALTHWTHALGHCVIEIGSFRGRSLAMSALALRASGSDSLLISVDPHEAEPCNREHVRLMLRQLGEEHRLVQFTCPSDRACKMLQPGGASLIFVDGDHSYGQVLQDFANYRDLLAPGGCLLFHDYGYGNHNGRPEADPDVRRAIDEQVFGSSAFRPLLLGHTLLAFVKEA